LDKVLKPEAIIASNTSSISITELASSTKRSDKVIGMHFMNPVPVMKLVEVIRGLQTSDHTLGVTQEYRFLLNNLVWLLKWENKHQLQEIFPDL